MRLIPEAAAVRSSAGTRWATGAIALTVLAADQVSKSLVLAAHPAGAAGTGWISVRLVRNTGASGGLASGHPVLVTVTAVAVTALAVGLALRSRGRAAALCLAAVVGGAAGNLADRIFRAPGFGRGGVVDWIHFGTGGGSLDLADLAIQFGVLGALIAIFAGDRARRAPAARQARESRLATGPRAGCRAGAKSGWWPRIESASGAAQGEGAGTRLISGQEPAELPPGVGSA